MVMNCIVNKTDFKFLVQFKDTTNTPVHPLDFEWDLYYYTTPDVQFIASHRLGKDHPDQHILTPNIVIHPNDETIEVRVDNFDFCRKGQLKFKSNFFFKNTDFSDGIQTIPTPEKNLNITIL